MALHQELNALQPITNQNGIGHEPSDGWPLHLPKGGIYAVSVQWTMTAECRTAVFEPFKCNIQEQAYLLLTYVWDLHWLVCEIIFFTGMTYVCVCKVSEGHVLQRFRLTIKSSNSHFVCVCVCVCVCVLTCWHQVQRVVCVYVCVCLPAF